MGYNTSSFKYAGKNVHGNHEEFLGHVSFQREQCVGNIATTSLVEGSTAFHSDPAFEVRSYFVNC